MQRMSTDSMSGADSGLLLSKFSREWIKKDLGLDPEIGRDKYGTPDENGRQRDAAHYLSFEVITPIYKLLIESNPSAKFDRATTERLVRYLNLKENVRIKTRAGNRVTDRAVDEKLIDALLTAHQTGSGVKLPSRAVELRMKRFVLRMLEAPDNPKPVGQSLKELIRELGCRIQCCDGTAVCHKRSSLKPNKLLAEKVELQMKIGYSGMRPTHLKPKQSSFNADEKDETAEKKETVLNTELCSHQIDAIEWMQAQECECGDAPCGGLLADDMGLGKTLTCLALIARGPSSDGNSETTVDGLGRTLIVLPKALLISESWQKEIDKHFVSKPKTLVYVPLTRPVIPRTCALNPYPRCADGTERAD
jgi:hypothetical protein